MLEKLRLKKYKKLALISILILAVVIFLLPNFIFAQSGADNTVWGGQQGNISNAIGLSNTDVRIVIARIIRIFLGFLGILAVLIVIYAGWLWMTSGGSQDQIDKAKDILKNAIIGLIIILLSWSLATFVLNMLYSSINGGAGGPGGPGGGGNGLPSLGSGIIESHYPGRDQTGVPRNTVIVVTFKEPINPNTIFDPVTNLITSNVVLYQSSMGASASTTNVIASTTDNLTFVFIPQALLGSPSANIWHTVDLMPGIIKQNGNPAFPGAIAVGYSWKFEVSTFVDLTPPTIVSIFPAASSTEPMNVVITVVFSEPINPLYVLGANTNTSSIEINANVGTTPIPGNYYVSNNYQTVEFLSNNSCGTNSCGNKIYCLPGNAAINTLIKAATLLAAGQPTAKSPADGIVDMANNSLDGNADGAADGPNPPNGCDLQYMPLPDSINCPGGVVDGDNAFWDFNTNNTINITVPTITAINPVSNANNIPLNTSPTADFSKPMMSSTFNSTNVNVQAIDQFGNINPINYSINLQGNQQTAIINYYGLQKDYNYQQQFTSGIKDKYQNCFTPSDGLGCGAGGATPSCCDGTPQANPCF